MAVPFINLIPFAFRQFTDPNYAGTRIADISKEDFTARINAIYESREDKSLTDGYAPFCKHLFVEN
eukprot:CAMPEP_0184342644 /NCGR_PEP_ID=MMETSP1089-20130417/11232_1 /TAXON_ID=38269 ORGANISM="Gloeochaete wittrockiana, Strain SAG46.84" /NCGR_SAMPLE_ID=MMETSP1089 /ASSEMBLY_ACC=CAM_ASM_000445 /LENGTH=65 /DNA_ID=CAMNT_0026671601 /DNA_START=51 /DNA_END=245 /DNA_ORIENTATION=+